MSRRWWISDGRPQPHSVRAALTGLRKRGFAITREKNDAGVTVYRLAEAGK